MRFLSFKFLSLVACLLFACGCVGNQQLTPKPPRAGPAQTVPATLASDVSLESLEESSVGPDQRKGRVISVSQAELEEFQAFLSEGGKPAGIPEFLSPKIRKLTLESIMDNCRGDNLCLLDYVKDTEDGTLYAFMAPYKVDPEARTVTVGFHGVGMVFTAEQARVRWRRLKNTKGSELARQASDIADYLLAEEELALVQGK